jgi:molecular chaperone GrpE
MTFRGWWPSPGWTPSRAGARRAAGRPAFDLRDRERALAERAELEREALQREAARREIADREALRREAARREAAQREARRREAIEREAIEREAAEREAIEREAAERLAEGARREATRREVAERVASGSEEAERAEPSPRAADPTVRAALDDLAAREARVERNAQRIYDETRGKLVSELLPIADNLDRTLAASPASSGSSTDAIVEGVRMVRAQLEQLLARHGVERVDALGEPFDPALHHAVALRETGPDEAGRVVDQCEAGYRFGGKVLRPAKVVVGTHA